jgi:hypothetical protein
MPFDFLQVQGLFFRHHFQTGSGTHTTGTGIFFPGGKLAMA